MEQIALIMNNRLSLLAADTFFATMETDNSKSHQSVTIRKLYFLSGFSPPSHLFMVRQGTSLVDTFENDNKSF